jgi:hypothetical protein
MADEDKDEVACAKMTAAAVEQVSRERGVLSKEDNEDAVPPPPPPPDIVFV